ncbi:MAG: YnbE family lipoprotein [Pseudomonadota bacterium]
MTCMKLTGPRVPAALVRTQREGEEQGITEGRLNRAVMAGALMIGGAMLGGCINVAAPDEPIVIELNINIRQEVIYRLAEDAADTIEENSDIF